MIKNTLTNILIVGMVLSVGAVSCARIGRLTGARTQSDKARLLNCMVPVNMSNSVTLESGTTAGEFLIMLPNSNEILLYNADSDPIDLNRLDELAKAFADNAKLSEHAVYIEGAVDVSTEALMQVVDVLRKNRIETVRFLTSGRARPENEDCTKGWSDIPPPDRYLETRLFDVDRTIDGKPNPLTLVVTPYFDKLSLNNEPVADENALDKKLVDIFRQREENGVFREHTNEIEKTVYLEIGEGNKDREVNFQKFGFVVALIDTLRSAASSPIILGNPMRNIGVVDDPRILDDDDEYPPPPPAVKTFPKIISGGVLNGKATFLPKPPYPPAAKAVRASGPVSVQVTVDENGNVAQAEAVSGHPLLRAAAAQAARQAKFAPTLLSGQKVKVSGVLTYNFVPDPQQ